MEFGGADAKDVSVGEGTREAKIHWGSAELEPCAEHTGVFERIRVVQGADGGHKLVEGVGAWREVAVRSGKRRGGDERELTVHADTERGEFVDGPSPDLGG